MNHHIAVVTDTVKRNGYTVDMRDRVPGLFMEDGTLATITLLVEFYETHGAYALAALVGDSFLIHG